jgi:hypothetical protein
MKKKEKDNILTLLKNNDIRTLKYSVCLNDIAEKIIKSSNVTKYIYNVKEKTKHGQLYYIDLETCLALIEKSHGETAKIFIKNINPDCQSACCNDNKAYSCTHCDFKSDKKSNMERHIKNVHKENIKLENKVRKSRESKYECHDHIKIVHLSTKTGKNVLLFKCKLCGYEADKSSNIIRHLEGIHFPNKLVEFNKEAKINKLKANIRYNNGLIKHQVYLRDNYEWTDFDKTYKSCYWYLDHIDTCTIKISRYTQNNIIYKEKLDFLINN